MRTFSIIEELFYGMACICDAQELVENGAAKEQIMERLIEASDALESFSMEIIKHE